MTVGMPKANAALDVGGHEDGSGTKTDPYIGQSDYLTIGQGTPVTETKTTSYTADVTDGTKLSVYEVDHQNAYIGIGTDAQRQYRLLFRNGERGRDRVHGGR